MTLPVPVKEYHTPSSVPPHAGADASAVAKTVVPSAGTPADKPIAPAQSSLAGAVAVHAGVAAAAQARPSSAQLSVKAAPVVLEKLATISQYCVPPVVHTASFGARVLLSQPSSSPATQVSVVQSAPQKTRSTRSV